MKKNIENGSLTLPYHYSKLVQQKLKEQGKTVPSRSLIQKVRRKYHFNMEVMRALNELSDEYKQLIKAS